MCKKNMRFVSNCETSSRVKLQPNVWFVVLQVCVFLLRVCERVWSWTSSGNCEMCVKEALKSRRQECTGRSPSEDHQESHFCISAHLLLFLMNQDLSSLSMWDLISLKSLSLLVSVDRAGPTDLPRSRRVKRGLYLGNAPSNHFS